MKRAHRRFMALATLVAALTLMAGLAAGFGSSASAHDDAEAHPAHIHSGTCDTLGDVVYPLNDVTLADKSATPKAEMASTPMPDMMASPTPDMENAATSTTTVQASLADIIAGGHAINVHESKDNIQNYIACGEITGTPTDNMLQITLRELNDSGYRGTAWLKDNGDGTTTVTIALSEEDYGTPETDTGAATGAVAIEIKGFAYSQPILEIPAGTTVTWTNNDQTAHTVSQAGGKGFESGKIEPGASFSFTFDTPGTYDYFCQYHANMKATIVVK